MELKDSQSEATTAKIPIIMDYILLSILQEFRMNAQHRAASAQFIIRL